MLFFVVCAIELRQILIQYSLANDTGKLNLDHDTFLSVLQNTLWVAVLLFYL